MKKEGRRIRSIDPMNFIIPFIMPERNGASNLFKTSFDITEAEKFLREKRLSGMKNIGHMHIIMSAYVRTISKFPGINRYIRGQHIYARNGIVMCLAIKKQMTIEAQETVIKVNANPTDTLDDIYKKVTELVEENKQEGDRNSMDKAARILTYIPGVLLKLCVWLLKTMDYFGLLPRFLVNLSPFHGSMFITNMGSLGIEPIYHHLYNFGNIPVFIGMGKRKKKLMMDETGKVIERKIIEVSFVSDERICDGHYYAEALKQIKKYIEKPWLLDLPPETVAEDIR